MARGGAARQQSKALLPRRSRPIIQLTRPSCLGCVKAISREDAWETICEHRALRKCKRCAGMHKPCVELPEKFNKHANHVFKVQAKALRARDGEGTEAAKQAAKDAALKAGADFKKAVELWLRRRKRRGGDMSGPQSVETLLRTMIPLLKNISDSFDQLVDIKRLENRLEPIVRDEDDSEDGLDAPTASECDSGEDFDVEEDVVPPAGRR